MRGLSSVTGPLWVFSVSSVLVTVSNRKYILPLIFLSHSSSYPTACDLPTTVFLFVCLFLYLRSMHTMTHIHLNSTNGHIWTDVCACTLAPTQVNFHLPFKISSIPELLLVRIISESPYMMTCESCFHYWKHICCMWVTPDWKMGWLELGEIRISSKINRIHSDSQVQIFNWWSLR